MAGFQKDVKKRLKAAGWSKQRNPRGSHEILGASRHGYGDQRSKQDQESPYSEQHFETGCTTEVQPLSNQILIAGEMHRLPF